MALEITPESHLDHGLLPEHIAFIRERFANRTGFFRETIAIPFWLPPLMCGLYGPAMGDPPVRVALCAVRDKRNYTSRVVSLPKRPTSILTVIGGHPPVKENGPHAVDSSRCVLYTAFGGPLTPREPGDPAIVEIEDLKESVLFWSNHALSYANTTSNH